ncbi:metallophosphoesterase [bacterium]|nr:metallophosphoesterase [bacterium]
MKKFCNLIIILLAGFCYSQDIILPRGSEWMYLDDGATWNAGWTTFGFNDSGWKTGNAQLGYGDGDENTKVSYGSSSSRKYPATCFRASFNLDSHDSFKYYVVKVLRDDGAVVHINGKEVLRSNMPDGDINHLTWAASTVSGSAEDTFYDYLLTGELMIAGKNTIAVSVHQRKGSSSDISFDLELLGTNEMSFDSDGPYVFYRDNQIVVKSIKESGPCTEIYADKSSAQLMCHVTAIQDSFTVILKEDLPIPEDQYQLPGKILAISDIEGNFKGFKMILQGAEVMDDRYNWTFGTGHLILVGDLFDRGESVTECLWLIYRLESLAEEVGGSVHFILGNHDIMNMIADTRYVHPRYFTNASLLGENYNDLYAVDTELGRWLRSKNTIEKVGDLIFVHGGISPEVASLNLSLTEMNSIVRDCIDTPAVDSNSILLTRSDGLYWYRGLVKKTITESQLDVILNALNSSRIIVGHSVVDEISGLYDGRVIAIDLDHEENTQNGWMHALYIDDGKFYIIDNNGNAKLFLSEDLSGVPSDVSLPQQYRLFPAYPNPFNPETTIMYSVPRRAEVMIEIYNLRGQKIKNLVREFKNTGVHQVVWDGMDNNGLHAGSGVYVYRMCAGDFSISRKITLVK